MEPWFNIYTERFRHYGYIVSMLCRSSRSTLNTQVHDQTIVTHPHHKVAKKIKKLRPRNGLLKLPMPRLLLLACAAALWGTIDVCLCMYVGSPHCTYYYWMWKHFLYYYACLPEKIPFGMLFDWLGEEWYTKEKGGCQVIRTYKCINKQVDLPINRHK